MKLNFYHLGSGPNLIILHGLFGSATNFRSLAKIYGAYFTVYCLDLRNHGASPHDNDVSIDAMAADIIEFMDDQGLENTALMGHSLGGKVAMQVAFTYPERITSLIAGDIAPVVYPRHHDRIFEGMKAVSRATVSSRKEAEQILTEFIESSEVRLFLLTNLTRAQDNALRWRINVDGLEAGYQALADKPGGTPYNGPSLFIRGALSDYVKEAYFPEIYRLFPKAEIITLEGAGHWLHAEKPEEYAKNTLNFLQRV